MYVLMTFYNRQTEDNPSWEVYGHKSPHDNDFIKGYTTRIEAIECALKYGVPIMQGSVDYGVVRKLCL